MAWSSPPTSEAILLVIHRDTSHLEGGTVHESIPDVFSWLAPFLLSWSAGGHGETGKTSEAQPAQLKTCKAQRVEVPEDGFWGVKRGLITLGAWTLWEGLVAQASKRSKSSLFSIQLRVEARSGDFRRP